MRHLYHLVRSDGRITFVGVVVGWNYLEEGVEIGDFDIYSAGDVGALLEQSGLTVHHAGVHGDAHLLGREEGVHVVHVLGGRRYDH